MEESIAGLCRSLASFSNHLESSCDALTHSVLRRPIPLDSASSTFIHSLNRRVSSASSDLNLLESISLGTVSFQELLGHCSELYKNNDSQLLQLQDRLKPLGFVPELEIDDNGDDDLSMGLDVEANIASSNPGHIALDDDDLFDESLSLKNFGLSNVCLASLASEGNNKTDEMDAYFYEPTRKKSIDVSDPVRSRTGVFKGGMPLDFEKAVSVENCSSTIELSRDDYESLPSFMKSLASWEDLLTAVEKISLRLNVKADGQNYFPQDEIASLELGPKARSYLLLLVRLKVLKVETIQGLLSYTLL